MIAILDTNILISALLDSRSLPARLVDAWTEQRFTLLTSEEQIVELKRVSCYPKISALISAPRAGRLVRELRASASLIGALPDVDICHDPNDNFLLAMAQQGNANFLVTGDKADLLGLEKFSATKIIAVRQFAQILAL